MQILYLLSHLFKLHIYELIQISNTKIMDNQKYKLEKLKKLRCLNVQILYLLSYLFKLYIYEMIQISNT